MFRFSEEIRKTGNLIYLYGSVGLGINWFGLEPGKALGYNVPGNSGFDMAGALGIIVIYLLISILTRGSAEITHHLYSGYEEGLGQVLKVKNASELVPLGNSSLEIQEIIIDIRRRVSILHYPMRLIGFLLFVVDFIFPLTLGIFCLLILYRSIFSAISTLAHRIVAQGIL
jgi:hypothetical protein